MTGEEAGKAVSFLNAVFPRDALEPESFAIWVAEISELGHAPSALAAARMIGRNGDRFPTLKEFRQAYRQAFDRWTAGHTIGAADDAVPPPPEAHEMLARIKNGAVLRSIDALPVSESISPRPVWARWQRRETLGTVSPASPEEKHDAILVLRDYEPHGPGDELICEAQRIMDEASA